MHYEKTFFDTPTMKKALSFVPSSLDDAESTHLPLPTAGSPPFFPAATKF